MHRFLLNIMKAEIKINDEINYTGFCDKQGTKIFLGDKVQFTSWQGAVWNGFIEIDDGMITVSILNAEQVENPKDWNKTYDWIGSRWWGTQVGYGEYGTWNCTRKHLAEIAGNFKEYDDYKEAQDKSLKKYGGYTHEYLYRPLPVLVVSSNGA